MYDIATKLTQLSKLIIDAECRYGREPGGVKLLAASKGQPIKAIKIAYAAGQRLMGENYAQEALRKIQALQAADIEWHFIGRIQSNKTKIIAKHFSWVHSVDCEKVAQRLDDQRSRDLSPLNVLIELNIDREPYKGGIDLLELPRLAEVIRSLPKLRLRGLMVIPAYQEEFAKQRDAFKRARVAQESLQAQGFVLDTLSMGMSHDFEAAIAEGATIVRIGTGIFGPRLGSVDISLGQGGKC